ncbi:MAG: DUF1565 domain-containing protein, partial [Dehalococcoidia bacterium]|nr:DUF1565 domain-containing protein [Dehalococcoidia bacterium]
MYLGSGTAYCNISGNNAANNDYGIHLFSSSGNNLANNIASNNDYCGICLSSSHINNNLTNNTANLN